MYRVGRMRTARGGEFILDRAWRQLSSAARAPPMYAVQPISLATLCAKYTATEQSTCRSKNSDLDVIYCKLLMYNGN